MASFFLTSHYKFCDNLEKERKLQILKTAQKRFSKHGLGKTTLDEIARDLRIGKATLYYYFTSKEDLYFQTIAWEFNQFLEEIKNIFADESGDLTNKFLRYFELKESSYSRNKLVFELFVYAFKEDIFEIENNLLKDLLDKEKEYIATILPGKKDKTELADFLVMKSWCEMLSGKIKGVINPDKQFNKNLNQRLLDSLLQS